GAFRKLSRVPARPQSGGNSAAVQGMTCVGTTVVPARVNSNRKVQVLRIFWPATFGGRKPQCCADCMAMLAKYLLGPRFSSSANCTSPDGSTSTLTVTFTVPLI